MVLEESPLVEIRTQLLSETSLSSTLHFLLWINMLHYPGLNVA